MAGKHVAEVLFEQFAVAFARGDAPEVAEYLDRAGPEADELAGMIDAYLAHSAPAEPSEEQVELMRAWAQGQSPLVVLRTRQGLKRADVVRALLETFGFAPEKEEKVGRYYHQLEAGTLDTRRADRRLWDVLAKLLHADASRLPSLRPRPLGIEPQAAYYRESATLTDAAQLATPSPVEEPDEVDRLFGITAP